MMILSKDVLYPRPLHLVIIIRPSIVLRPGAKPCCMNVQRYLSEVLVRVCLLCVLSGSLVPGNDP